VIAGPVRSAVRGGLSRRRVPTVVIAAVLLVTTAASVLGLALVVDSNAPFDRAFAAAHGADAAVTFNSGRASATQLAATSRLPGVTAAAGPFTEVTAGLQLAMPGDGSGGSAQLLLPAMTIAGRSSPGGPVDDVTLEAGHWASGPGQIVLAQNQPGSNLSVSVSPGAQVTVTGVPGRPALTVVGIASSVTGTADAWVTPAEVGRLAPPHAAGSAQMLYRFARAGSAADLRAGVAAVARALPAGAVSATMSYLSVRLQEVSGIAPLAPFVVTFGVIGLIMSVVIVANVVSGAVVAGYRRIGILKSIGFTPGQVASAYSAQALLPALAGCLAGLALGNLLSGALLDRAANVYQVGTLGVPPWVNLGVPVAMLILVALAALIPAARAGRLSAVQAITAGRAPRRGRGYWAHRVLGRLPLPRPATIGLAGPFARPARAAVTALAILLGAITVTFAIGLGISLGRVQEGLSLSKTEQAFVFVPQSGPAIGGVRMKDGHPVGSSATKTPQEVTAAIIRQQGTLHVTEESDQQVTVAGLAQQVPVTAYRGDAGWIGYDMISGRWYSGAGQIDVPTYFLTATGKSVGDTVTMTFGDRTFSARIVGQIFSSVNNGLSMVTDWQTLASADAHLVQPSQWDIQLRPGTSGAAYLLSLGTELGPNYAVGLNGAGRGLSLVLGLITLLTLALAIVAGLGVLNTVVLQTRERVHDLGVFRAIGMTPRQTIAMVICWVAGIGLLAGIAAVPIGVELHRYLVPFMASAAGTALPSVILNVYEVGLLALLALAGAAIAIAGALPPAGWAASARTEQALRAE
jgi:putative ABC transport system permease protein